jgi:beta-lactamase regulating signal transducer with metallopeptidase domain/uncharacterized membrane protein YkoI
MSVLGDWFLTFLVNSVWEIATLVALALIGEWIVRRSSARSRHTLWVGTLVLALVVPIVTSAALQWPTAQRTQASRVEVGPDRPVIATDAGDIVVVPERNSSLAISGITALVLVVLYGGIVLYRSARLLAAWIRTRRMFASSETSEPNRAIRAAVDRCCSQFGIEGISVLFSYTLTSPVTIGTRKPVVILPEAMKDETDEHILLSAIGHELVHITRRDYLWNLIYEVAILPLSFHPAVAFLKRRISHTRELCCDELVTRQLIKAEDYARSLVQLASSAAVFAEPAMTTVGMGDADDLEVRIMSLLKGSVARPNGRKYLAIGAAFAVLAIGVAVGGFGFKIGVTEVNAQKTEKQEPCKEIGPDCTTLSSFTRDDQDEIRELRAKIAAENPNLTEGQISERIAAFKARRGQDEVLSKQQAVDQAKLAKEATVSMDVAIQTATALVPGIVLESTLVRERGLPMYRIVVLDKDSPEGDATFMLVNAQNGQIVANDKVRMRTRSPE